MHTQVKPKVKTIWWDQNALRTVRFGTYLVGNKLIRSALCYLTGVVPKYPKRGF